MQIGDTIKTYTIEPLEDPVPREAPAEPTEERVEAPREVERVGLLAVR
jgi:hypothetical protein